MNVQDAINRINLGKSEIIREYNNTVDEGMRTKSWTV